MKERVVLKMIQVKNLSKSFENCIALDNCCMNVKKSSIYGLVGPNGAGKTTLIKHLAGILRQDSGFAGINGEDIYDNPRVKSRIAYIPEDVHYFFNFRIEEMAHFYKNVYHSWNQERYERLKGVFQIKTSRRIRRLSKGMKKQVAFWLGICMMPRVFLLDEPVDGMDPVVRRRVWNILIQDAAENGTTVLVSSHNLRELEDICDHVGIMHNGRINIERNLDDMKAEIHKIQVVFSGGIPEGLLAGIKVLNETRKGSIINLIVKGEIEEILSRIRTAKPSVLDTVSLTLEEVFIYELGGMGYEVGSIIV